jgi:DNA repair protein RadC
MEFFNDDAIIKQSSTVPELKLSYRSTVLSKEPLTEPDATAEFLRKIFDAGKIELQEQSILLMLDEMNRPICFYHLSSGFKHETARDFPLLLKILLAVNPDSFILSHNHPGVFAFPSPQDLDVVFSFKRLAEYFQLVYRDEIIISKEGYYSFEENHLMW